jgi:hypothetical protein
MTIHSLHNLNPETKLRLIGEWIENNIQNEEAENVISSINQIADEITDLKRRYDVRLREENEYRQIRRTAYLKQWR